MQHRLKPKYQSYRIEKQKDGARKACFKLINPTSSFSSASGGAYLTHRYNRAAEDQFSGEAIKALRQIHPRLAQSDKQMLDSALRQLQENWFQRQRRKLCSLLKR